MNLRFAVASDLHIALPETINHQENRFHLVEVSIPALEVVLSHLETLDLDFLLLPGDLTQDGGPENHQWLQQRLACLPFPVYVIPGNHDVPALHPTSQSIGLDDFPNYYCQFGYYQTQQLYYTREILPGVQLIGLNSNYFDSQGKQLGWGRLDQEQLTWLEQLLTIVKEQLVLVMIHHNVVEHLPGQSYHELGKRYMLENASILKKMLRNAGVKFIFTGHLHVQDIAYEQGIYEITTGSLVSYPHPYRVLQLHTNQRGDCKLTIESHRVKSVPGWDDLLHYSRNWMGDRSFPFMVRLLTSPPLKLSETEAEKLAPYMRYFWADIANGDPIFDFPDFPTPVRHYLRKFSALSHDGTPTLIDNHATLLI